VSSPELQDGDLLFVDRGLDYVRNVKDIRAGLVNIVRSAASALGSESASFYLLQQRTDVLEPFILVNIPDAYFRACSSVPLGTRCCGRAALHKTPWAVIDLWNDPAFADCSVAAVESGLRASISVPVMMPADECIGTLAVHFRSTHEPRHAEIALLSLFARIISLSLIAELEKRNTNYRDWISEQLAEGPRAA
jgi:GAF domain-containing protein